MLQKNSKFKFQHFRCRIISLNLNHKFDLKQETINHEKNTVLYFWVELDFCLQDQINMRFNSFCLLQVIM